MTATVPPLPHRSNPPASQLWPGLTTTHPLIAREGVYAAAREGNLARQIDLTCAPQLMSAERPAAEQNGGCSCDSRGQLWRGMAGRGGQNAWRLQGAGRGRGRGQPVRRRTAARSSGGRSSPASGRPGSNSARVVRARNARPVVTVCRGRRMTSMRSPALISPGTTTRRQVPVAPRAVNRLTRFGPAIRCANVAHGMRGEAACSTTVPPVRQRSPASVPVRSGPRVVRFSPNWPAGRSYPSSRSRQSRSSRAQAYTAWSVPPWCPVVQTMSPARPFGRG